MPNPNYIAGRAAEYAILRDLQNSGFACIRAAASHGIYDVVGVRRDCCVFVQAKRGKNKPTLCEYKTLVDMEVPEGAVKLLLYLPPGGSKRVLYCNQELPEWCLFMGWLEGMPPKQGKLRGL